MENKHCPLLGSPMANKPTFCTGESCAWFTGVECAIRTMGRVLSMFSEKKEK